MNDKSADANKDTLELIQQMGKQHDADVDDLRETDETVKKLVADLQEKILGPNLQRP